MGRPKASRDGHVSFILCHQVIDRPDWEKRWKDGQIPRDIYYAQPWNKFDYNIFPPRLVNRNPIVKSTDGIKDQTREDWNDFNKEMRRLVAQERMAN